jgi:hypothetical protein
MNKTIRIIRVIQKLLQDFAFINAHKKRPEAFTRYRKLTFGTIVATILQLAKRSLQIECNLLGDRLMTESVSKQAFSKARYKISHTGFIALNDRLLEEVYRDDYTGMWHGYRVFGVDGSTIHVPKSDETREYFGTWDRGADRNANCPIVARISEVVELTTGIVVAANIAPWSRGERSLIKDQIPYVTSLFNRLAQHKQLFVFDRGYISKELSQQILANKADFLFRVPRKFNHYIDILRGQGDVDTVVGIAPDLPLLRLIVRLLPSGEECVLLTSITDTKTATGDELFILYWRRWVGCEEGYKKQKIALELENFTGTGVEAILQEFWATVVAVNLFQIECLDEEGPWDIDNPPTERINRNVVFGSLRETIFSVIINEISAEEFHEKFLRIARRSRVKVRPERHYPRDGVKHSKRGHVFRRVC